MTDQTNPLDQFNVEGDAHAGRTEFIAVEPPCVSVIKWSPLELEPSYAELQQRFAAVCRRLDLEIETTRKLRHTLEQVRRLL